MAIYHLSMQIISRSKGQSVVAAASYRSGDRLMDERTGEEKFYRREVQPDTMILAPFHSPEWVHDRERLWNEVEKVEKRKDSQLAREINIALPRELSNDQQKELIHEYVKNEFVNKGMVADIAIHRDDKENPHAHVMLTMRTIDEEGFGKKNRDWNADFANSKKNIRGFVKSSENCLDIREQWSEYANKALEKAGIQERISHLSHEARGLEQLPTVHLGHVAHEMEKRGVQTDRGNINHDRQEYNRLVVDLQKYREEKQALEQEKARQQEQKQTSERFNTPAERVDLQNASKLLKAEPSLKNIKKRYEQLDKWEKRLDNNMNYLQWKDKTIREASDHFRWINSFRNQIQQEQQKIENINWMNPLKIKENRATKAQSESWIEHHKGEIKFHDEKIDYYREKLDFKDEKEFRDKESQYQAERPSLIEKNKNQRQQIKTEQDTLQKAQKALENRFIRRVASKYPDRPEMAHMSLQTAQKLFSLNKEVGQVVPIETVKKVLNNHKQELQRLQEEINRVEHNQSRLQRAEGYLKNYEKHHALVEKYENNPFLKGKVLVSKSARQEYDHAVSARDHYHNLMKNEGISGRKDFEKQTDTLAKMKDRIPEYEKQVQSHENGKALLGAILNGIEQAGREMQREQQRQQQQAKGKRRGKRKYRSQENELGM